MCPACRIDGWERMGGVGGGRVGALQQPLLNARPAAPRCISCCRQH